MSSKVVQIDVSNGTRSYVHARKELFVRDHGKLGEHLNRISKDPCRYQRADILNLGKLTALERTINRGSG